MRQLSKFFVPMFVIVLAACRVADGPPVTPPEVQVTISPTAASMEPNESRTFTATVTGTADTAVTWSATCGTLAGTGNTVTYTAPEDEPECVVTATSAADPDASASAIVTVTVEEVEVTISPTSAQLEPNESRTFTATVTGTGDTGVTWSTTCGTITGSGSTVTYTAPGVAQTCVVTATSTAFPDESASATVTVTAPTEDFTVTSDTDPTEPSLTLPFLAGETLVIRVDVPSGQRGEDRRLVVEVGDDGGARQLDMVLHTMEAGTLTPYASTSGRAYFRPGLQGIGGGAVTTAMVLEPLVTVVGNCVGPCISRPADLATVYVEVTNASASAESVPFYAYTEPWIDEGETENRTVAGAVDVSSGDGYRGAIEHLGDADHVRFTEDGSVLFAEREGYDVNLVLDLFTAGGMPVATYRPGDPAFEVFEGEYARIRSDPASQRASVYGFYDVFYQ